MRFDVTKTTDIARDAAAPDATVDVVRRLIDETVVTDEAPQIAPAAKPRVSTGWHMADPDMQLVAGQSDRPILSIALEDVPRDSRLRLFAGRVLTRTVRFFKRPDAPRWLALVTLMVAIAAWPWTVATLVGVALAGAAITWFTLGPDRASELVAEWHANLARRDPDAAESLRRRAALVTRVIAGIADKLPERWTAGLYLPDFEPEREMPDKMKDDPFDRLSRHA
jgi:hypothetical protein